MLRSAPPSAEVLVGSRLRRLSRPWPFAIALLLQGSIDCCGPSSTRRSILRAAQPPASVGQPYSVLLRVYLAGCSIPACPFYHSRVLPRCCFGLLPCSPAHSALTCSVERMTSDGIAAKSMCSAALHGNACPPLRAHSASRAGLCSLALDNQSVLSMYFFMAITSGRSSSGVVLAGLPDCHGHRPCHCASFQSPDRPSSAASAPPSSQQHRARVKVSGRSARPCEFCCGSSAARASGQPPARQSGRDKQGRQR